MQSKKPEGSSHGQGHQANVHTNFFVIAEEPFCPKKMANEALARRAPRCPVDAVDDTCSAPAAGKSYCGRRTEPFEPQLIHSTPTKQYTNTSRSTHPKDANDRLQEEAATCGRRTPQGHVEWDGQCCAVLRAALQRLQADHLNCHVGYLPWMQATGHSGPGCGASA